MIDDDDVSVAVKNENINACCVYRAQSAYYIHLRREDHRDESEVCIQGGPREECRRETTIKAKLEKTSILKAIVNGTIRWIFSAIMIFEPSVQHDFPSGFANFRFCNI